MKIMLCRAELLSMSSYSMYLAADVPDFMHGWLSYCGDHCALSRLRWKRWCEICIVLVERILKSVRPASCLLSL